MEVDAGGTIVIKKTGINLFLRSKLSSVVLIPVLDMRQK